MSYEVRIMLFTYAKEEIINFSHLKKIFILVIFLISSKWMADLSNLTTFSNKNKNHQVEKYQKYDWGKKQMHYNAVMPGFPEHEMPNPR